LISDFSRLITSQMSEFAIILRTVLQVLKKIYLTGIINGQSRLQHDNQNFIIKVNQLLRTYFGQAYAGLPIRRTHVYVVFFHILEIPSIFTCILRLKYVVLYMC